jgi:Flp pilus assembly protein TadD
MAQGAKEPVVIEKGGGEAQFSLAIEPDVSFPLGDSADQFNLGGGGLLRGELAFPKLRPMFFGASIGYAYSPLQYERSMSSSAAALIVGAEFELGSFFSIRPFLEGGAYNSFLNEPTEMESGAYAYFGGGLGFDFDLAPSISLGLVGKYQNYYDVYGGLAAGLSLTIHPGAGKRASSVRILQFRFDDVFSVFYKYYDDHSLGDAMLVNGEANPITDVKATLQIKEYMDSPKDCRVASTLKPGESQKISLYGLFKDKVLDITEATKVPVEVTVEYTLKGERRTAKAVQTLRVLDRNAMTWDDDRRVAAFVTAKDPSVLSFSKNVLAAAGSKAPGALDRNLVLGMALHDALALGDLSYSPDPSRPYSETSKDKAAADFLQFPRQTLEYRAGDCDDLSILNCALLESLNVETAFITVPGHIFMAFALDATPDSARKTFLAPEDLIFKDGKAWVPVEITRTKDDFFDAWLLGAKEWRESENKAEAKFFTLRDAWAAFEPVGLPGTGAPPKIPAEAELQARLKKDLARFVDRETAPRVAALRAEIKTKQNDPKIVNKLAVLYARYGQSDKAEAELLGILAKSPEFVPALVNMGNLALLAGDSSKAITYFGKAYRKEAANPYALLGLAKAYYQKGDSTQARSFYQKLQDAAPDLAEGNSYLKGESGSTRSADIAASGKLEWAEE